MTSNRFSIKSHNLHSSIVVLSGKEHHHLARVARIKPNEKVWLFDEQGTNYLARVDEIRKERTRLVILERWDKHEPRVKITLAQAILKSKKMDDIIHKATELGVITIIPVISVRTIVRIGDKAQKKGERWKKIAQEASKQDKSCPVPSIWQPIDLKKLIEEGKEERRFLLSEHRGKYLKEILLDIESRGELPLSVQVLVGAEGGWTEEEEKYILKNGYEAVSLGRQIFRAETAALSSLAMMTHFWNS